MNIDKRLKFEALKQCEQLLQDQEKEVEVLNKKEREAEVEVYRTTGSASMAVFSGYLKTMSDRNAKTEELLKKRREFDALAKETIK